ncbi:MAG: phosphate acyltransferase PlsX [Ignavibacteria bacterium]|nr:phosphate acyltransferase PlsX [Ignavibacteria bacterium]
MGGDFAPEKVVLGGVEAFNKFQNRLDVILVGKKGEIQSVLLKNQLSFPDDKIVNATEVIEMGEMPTDAIRNKPDSSIVIAARLVKEGKAQAFVSAGNTGAVAAASTLIMGRIEGVDRPTIGAILPSESGFCAIFDVGAFVDAKPQHLLSYALMAEIYVREILKVDNPSIGLLSVGEEKDKGNKLTKDAFDLISKSKLNFIGNVEGRDILKGTANIVICDGFIGNILLKFGESVPKYMKHLLTLYAKENLFKKIKIGLFKNTLKEALSPLDYQKYGGVPLLGVNGITIIGHGSSTSLAIENMILRAYEVYERKITERIKKTLAQISVKE